MLFSGASFRNEIAAGIFLWNAFCCYGQIRPERTKTGGRGVSGFTLDYSSVGGPELGAGVHERESHLRLDSGKQEAVLERHRSESDSGGEPIGTFRAQLPADAFSSVLEYANKERLAELPKSTGGGPGKSAMTVRLEQQNSVVTKTLTSGDIPLLGQLQYFFYQLNRISTALMQHPVQAARVSVAAGDGSRYFNLTIENIGSADICFADPRLLGPGGEDLWAGVRVAEVPVERPGVTSPPLKWTRINLMAKREKAGVAETVVLKPGANFTAPTETWSAPHRGANYLVQAVWSNYSGPPEGVGCYRLRGAAFSQNLTILGR